jgi:glycosyltransferase involved in cell wall biosynthesis
VRILVVNWLDLENPAAGGAEIHLFEIFGRLAAQGHEVMLIASGWRGAPLRATVRGIEVRRTGSRYGFTVRARGAVRRALTERPWDVVVEDINKVPLYLPGLTRLPFYAIVPHLFGTTAFREAPWPMAALVWLAERGIPAGYRRAHFHAISRSTRDDLVVRGVAPGRVHVVEPGVDTAWFHPDPAEPRDAVPTFLYVGRLKRYKGVDTAIRAFARVRPSHPAARFDIAGQGDDRSRLERLVTELGLGASVRFLGYVPEAAKRSLLRRAWATVFPSPKEGWGITNAEAAACGTPAVAADSPGLRDSVRHDETGLLVPFGDVNALGSALERLAGDPALVARLGRGGRAFAETLSWDRAARETAHHLSLTIGAASAGRGGKD